MANRQSSSLPNRSGERLHAGISDSQLLARFNAVRDESAEQSFSALVHRHGPMVLRVCHQVLGDRHRAEDAFQATFLVLARRAGSIRQPELLGNWLYGVAVRAAWESLMRDGRRRQHEAANVGDVEPSGDTDRPEATLIRAEEFQALHEEVARLPAHYRVPIVLCELEGLTYQQAAIRMRCPVSTVGVRLSRARDRLRVRLLRRGILPTAVIANAFLGAEGAALRVPSVLVSPTGRAAAGFAARDAVGTGLVSASVIAIAQAVLKTMALARLKLATSTLAVIALTATVGSIGASRPAWLPASSAPSRAAATRAEPPPQNLASAGPAIVHPSPAVAAQAAPKNADTAAQPAPDLEPPAAEGIVASAKKPETKPDVPVALASVRKPVRDEVARGELLFAKEWAPNDPVSGGGDGLGPLYNETSCVACHGLGAPGGAGPDSKNVVIVTALPRGAQRVPAKDLERVHPGFKGATSMVLHRYSTDDRYGLWRRRFYASDQTLGARAGNTRDNDTTEVHIQKLAAQTALQKRFQERSSRINAAEGITLNVTERNTPALFGAGRIDAIPSEVLVEEAAAQPEPVRGRVARNRDGAVGRFGWKAQIGTLHEFVRNACAGELGLQVAGHAQAVSPLGPLPQSKDPDMSEPDCDALVAYVRALPAPVAVDPAGPLGSEDMRMGRRLFAATGCATCHAPSLGAVRGIYSDLLLHDMGPGLTDSGVYYGSDGPSSPGGPSPGEWRTPPLWGFRDSGPYLHDGRAQTLEEAVALHGGQGTQAARSFFALAARERAQVEAFLKSLVAPTAMAMPGILLASDLEARAEPEDIRKAESLVRKQRAEAEARDVEKLREAARRQRAEAAVRRAEVQFPIAVTLEKRGKLIGALRFYRDIVAEAPDTVEGRKAAARIPELKSRIESP